MKPMLNLGWTLGLFALATAPFMAAPAMAEKWEFEVAPYLWAAGVDGKIETEDESYDIGADFQDVLEQTEFGAEVLFEANRGNWVSVLQADYFVLEDDDIEPRRQLRGAADVQLELDTVLIAAAAGWRFDMGKHTIDVLGGLRYAGIEAEISQKGRGDVSDNRDIYDAIVMVRSRFALTDKLTLMPSISVGGGDSDLVWELFPELIYDLGNVNIRFGYRNLNYDNQKSDNELDLSFRGLLLGAGWKF